LTPEQSSFWQTKQPEELYDLEADPDEVHNLAASPERKQILDRFRQAHRKWEHDIKDVGLLSEWEMHERSANSTPYEMGHDPQQYDFDAVFAAASMASSLSPDDLPTLVSSLSHDDSAVRYWAATGLLAQQQTGVAAGHEALIRALGDKSPVVQITAAEALGRFGDQSDAARAREVLIRYIQPEADAYLGVAAWNALDYLDERARPALPTLKSISPEALHVPQRVGGYGQRLKAATLEGLR
jgi:uncharacterized sulfatase